MALIEFENNTAPYLNAENLNNNFNEINNKTEKNVVVCRPPSNFSTTASQYTPITLGEIYKVGNKLTISNNSIVIGDNIDYVQIEAKIGVYLSTADQLYFYIQKNGIDIAETWTVQKLTDNGYYVIPLLGFIPVENGDVLNITVYSTNVQSIESGKTIVIVTSIKE